jgi:GTP-binding protein
MEKVAIPYSIDKLQDRGKFSLNQMLKFEGQVIGENRDDMCVNVTKEKNNLTYVLLK